ncbi:MAG TPA: fatty acid desaturase [Gammaproteobacteria bacterium]|nr:fatty acid desaturase [Gammaproteobacteria bacterium]
MTLDGVWNLSFWGYVAVTLALTHVTIASVTIFLHRHQAHRGLTLHPVVSHFFRLWLWLTTGMVTREWVAVHRKHHARCETAEDPHSPQVYGIWRVLFRGVGLYRVEALNKETLEIYGRGTPDDWLERHVYGQYRFTGLGITLLADLVLFGWVGLIIFAVQMAWIPFWAAGVINGVGHYLGYRNFETQDTSRNIVPIGILIGGEEFHNNHHAYGSSAKFSNKWWEIDLGWLYIRALELVGLASVKKIAPRASFSRSTATIDLDTLRAVVTNRFYLLKLYGRRVIAPVLHGLAEREPSFPRRQLARIRKLMIRENSGLREDPHVRQWLESALQGNPTLRTVYSFMQRLKALSAQTTGKTESDLKRLQAWCAEAEASGIRVLGDFARQLQAYTPKPV